MACSREFSGNLAHCPHDGNQLRELPQDQWEGKRLADRYKIERRLGTGGMGVVYLAWHELMERWVAIKMLKQSFVEDAQSVKRFQQEAKAASRLKHPNIITLYEFDVTPTHQPYMVMDYLVSTHPDPALRARSLAQEIRDCGQIPVERCIHILAQACDALDHAHRQGVIHRDVKPANIMIVPCEDDPDFVRVVDFGVAKLLPINTTSVEVQGLTQVGEVCGSPVYMSPEQCMGQSLDPRADIYSMGVVLYEAITGRLPLVGKNMVETMQKHMNETPPSFNAVRPDLFVPARIEQVVMRALSKHAHERQQTMSELAQDLQFAIPRAGQTPSLRAHEILPLESKEEKQLPEWIVPTATAFGVVTVIIAALVFAFFPRPGSQPIKAPRSAAVTAPPPALTPAVAPGAVHPVAASPATTVTNPAAPTATTPSVTPPPAEKPAVKSHKPVEQPHHTAAAVAVKHHVQPVHHATETVKPAEHSDPFKDLLKSKSYHDGQ